MKIKYNAPVILTFAFLCIIVLALKALLFPYLIEDFFTVPAHANFNPANPSSYLLLVSHVFGHADWNHLLGNLAFILLLGPLLEATYGSFMLFVMCFTTAFVTGVLNVCFMPQSLLGSSGIAFMMILLASFTNTNKGEIPLSFLTILVLYVVKDISTAFEKATVSHFAHLVGGVCGSLFGYFRPGATRPRTKKTTRTPKQSKQQSSESSSGASAPDEGNVQ